MTKERKMKVCAFCGRQSAHSIESHHIYGRAISDETIDICANCHAAITPVTNKVTRKLKEYKKIPLKERIRIGVIAYGVGFFSGIIYTIL